MERFLQMIVALVSCQNHAPLCSSELRAHTSCIKRTIGIPAFLNTENIHVIINAHYGKELLVMQLSCIFTVQLILLRQALAISPCIAHILML